MRKVIITVAPSPLNVVKRDLGVIVLVGILLLLLQGRVTEVVVWQFLLLLGYGLLGLGWIVFRTRRIVAKLVSQPAAPRDDP